MYQFHSLGQDQSTVAQRVEMTMDEHFLTCCMCTYFPERFQHYAWTTESSNFNFFGSRVFADLVEPTTCTFGRMTRVFYVPLR